MLLFQRVVKMFSVLVYYFLLLNSSVTCLDLKMRYIALHLL